MTVSNLNDLRLTASWPQEVSASYAFSPRGNYILVVDEKNAVVRQVKDGQIILSTASDRREISAFAFAPDDSKLIVPAPTNTANIYRLPKATILMELRGHVNRIQAVSWSGNGKLIATVAKEDGTFIWDATLGTVLRKIESKGYGVSFSPDSKLVGTVEHLPYYNPQLSPLHIRAWSIDSGMLAFSLRDVPMWDSNPPFTAHWQNPERDPHLAYSPDGTKFWFSSTAYDFSIRDFDAWQVRCHRALRDSRFFIVLLSPAYLTSEACRWEWEEWIKHELERGQVGVGAACHGARGD
jgi:WD40 repeat protein